MKEYKILLLSGGSLVGRNLIDVCEGRREQLQLITSNCLASEPSLFEFDRVFLSPALDSQPDEFAEFFDELIAQEAPDLIIPCRDEDVAFLANIKEKAPLQDLNSFLVGPLALASSFLDKWKSFDLSVRLGLPFAQTILASSGRDNILDFVHTVGLPIIAKPTKGFASKGVFLINQLAQIDALVGSQEYIFQEYLGNPRQVADYLDGISKKGVPLFHSFEEIKISVQASIGPLREFGGMVVTSHLMKQGISSLVDICFEEEVLVETRRWINAFVEAGWVGPLNIQCQKDQSGKLTIYEFNGRFTGATSARYHLGYDELGILMNLWNGKNLPNLFKGFRSGAVKRIPTSRSASLEAIAQLKSQGSWTNTRKSLGPEMEQSEL